MALEAVAAQNPRAMIEEILTTQALGDGGEYVDAAYQFLMLGATFTRDFFVKEKSFGSKSGTKNMARLEYAFTYLSNLEFLASLPIVDRLQIREIAQRYVDSK